MENRKLKIYDLAIALHDERGNVYEESVEAPNIEEAIKEFQKLMPEALKSQGWGEEAIIRNYIALQRDTPQ